VFQLIKAELKQWLIGQCLLWGYDKVLLKMVGVWVRSHTSIFTTTPLYHTYNCHLE